MRAIWKYPIPVGSTFDLEMPKGAVIRQVDAQEEGPVLWAEVQSHARMELRHFFLASTGSPIPDDSPPNRGKGEVFGTRLSYLGSFQFFESSMTGPFVGHLYEIVQDT